MRARRALVGALLVLTASSFARSTLAQPAADATEELRRGYALKLQGQCAEALPHFAASQQLAPSPKALLNMADCEQRLGARIAARTHAAEGRDLARQRGDAELSAVAESQLAAIESKLPRLTITLRANAPPDCLVTEDGSAVATPDLGSPQVVSPGRHSIRVEAAGYESTTVEVVVKEGGAQYIEVAPGPKLEATAHGAARAATSGSESALRELDVPRGNPSAGPGTRRIIALAIGGVGLVGVALGSVYGVKAIEKNHSSNADDHCDSTGCDSMGITLRNQALNDATVSTVAVAAGLAALAGGAIVYFTGSHAVQLAPVAGPSYSGFNLCAKW